MAENPLFDRPLSGLHLIEASAGTGKTTALTVLFLRAILEGFPVERILVVTFTESAAEEVRGRIHDLLVASRRKALGEKSEGRHAPFLERIRADHATPLARALSDFDRATMTTIHAFCRRLLREYAFEFKSPFSLELEENPGEAKLPALSEIWRRRVYPERPEIALLLASVFPGGPADFRSLVSDDALFRETESAHSGAPEEEDDFPGLREGYLRDLSLCREIAEDTMEEMARRWSSETPDHEGARGGKKKRKGEAGADVRLLLRRLREIRDQVPGSPPGYGPLDGVLQEWLTRVPPDERRSFAPLLRILEGKEAMAEGLRRSLKKDLLRYLRSEALDQREGRGRETFDDMILRVLEGLLADRSGSLSRKIRERFPVAFVDEFQDTDLAQFRIFDRIYRLSHPSPGEEGAGTALFLVGDPKQSIYRFRGADISAYLEARNFALTRPGGSLLGLSVNYRSDRRHVEALNTLFGLVPDPFLTGEAIRYDPVFPSREGLSAFRDPLAESEEEPIPLLLVGGEEGDRLDAYARRSAREVSRLLSGGPTISGRPVRPEEIALLVRTHVHGKLLQEALDERGIPSVSYGSGSVLETEEAFDLEMLLLSFASPENRRQARMVLASRFFGMTAAELRLLEDSPDLWNRRVDPFFEAARRWESRGAMGTLRTFFLDQGIFSRLLSQSGGKRRVTHLLHLFELLEDQCRDRPPLLLLVDRYLQARREAPGKKEDGNAPRLETCDGRVRILTLHKAKGLEFPVVILPFGLPGRQGREEEGEDPGERSEEMRLLYVALTRAVHRTVLMVPSSTSRQSAVGHLFGLGPDVRKGKAAFQGFALQIDRIVRENPVLFANVPDSPVPLAPPRQASEKKWTLAPPPPFPAISPAKRTESFSSLVRLSLGIHEEKGEELRASDEEGREGPEGEGPEESVLPAGPLFGSYFHRIMERLAREEAHTEGPPGAVPDGVLEGALDDLDLRKDPACQSWPEAVRPLVERTLSADLAERTEGSSPGEGGFMTLGRILRGERTVEQEFLLPVRGLVADRLQASLLPEGPKLFFEPVTGSLKGYIDLVFRFRGRFYLLDYKTNLLSGDSPYAPLSLVRAMAEHRYDLQGTLYILALHRLLSFFVPGYDYERDVGGALFLFVRGLGRPGEGIHRLRPTLSELLSFDRLLSGERP